MSIASPFIWGLAASGSRMECAGVLQSGGWIDGFFSLTEEGNVELGSLGEGTCAEAETWGETYECPGPKPRGANP